VLLVVVVVLPSVVVEEDRGRRKRKSGGLELHVYRPRLKAQDSSRDAGTPGASEGALSLSPHIKDSTLVIMSTCVHPTYC
jgi:hypothetical protein